MMIYSTLGSFYGFAKRWGWAGTDCVQGAAGAAYRFKTTASVRHGGNASRQFHSKRRCDTGQKTLHQFPAT